MDDRQEDRTKMYNSLSDILTPKKAILETIEQLGEDYDTFIDLLAQLNETVEKQIARTTGITIDKDAAKATMIGKAAAIANSLESYAARTANATLEAEMTWTIPKLNALREDIVDKTCQLIHDRAGENLAGLVKYKITTGELADLQNAIKTYKAAAPKIKTARAQKHTLTGDVVVLMDKIDFIIEKGIDLLIGRLTAIDPTLVNDYFNARKIDITGKRKRKKKESKEKKNTPPSGEPNAQGGEEKADPESGA
jgi:hypothetical protein